MSQRTGRPKVENPKTKGFSVKLDERTYAELDVYCERHDITKGAAVRRGIRLLLQKEKE